MRLAQYASDLRLALFDDLQSGREPREGTFDPEVLKEARSKGTPQMGGTRYEPDSLTFEFIYPDPQSSATVLSVRVATPERIVYLPVPAWVVEHIWQGEVVGSFAFESEAAEQVAEFVSSLDREPNAALFGPQPAKRRE